MYNVRLIEMERRNNASKLLLAMSSLKYSFLLMQLGMRIITPEQFRERERNDYADFEEAMNKLYTKKKPNVETKGYIQL